MRATPRSTTDSAATPAHGAVKRLGRGVERDDDALERRCHLRREPFEQHSAREQVETQTARPKELRGREDLWSQQRLSS
jgi:hypothetical protein